MAIVRIKLTDSPDHTTKTAYGELLLQTDAKVAGGDLGGSLFLYDTCSVL